jgi:hypothetical protein
MAEDFKSKLLEIVGDEGKVSEIVSNLHLWGVTKEQYNKKVGELTNLRTERDTFAEQVEGVKLEKMSAEEKLKHELDKLEGMKKDYSRKTNLLEVKSMFASKGINAEDYADVIEGLVSHDTDITKKVASGVIDMLVKQTEKAVSTTKEQVVNSTPAPSTTQQTDQKTVVRKNVY